MFKKNLLFIIFSIFALLFAIFQWYGNRSLPSYKIKQANDLVEKQKYNEALKLLLKVHKKKPDNFYVNKDIGRIYFLKDNYKLANKYFNKALKQRNDHEIIDMQNLIGLSN